MAKGGSVAESAKAIGVTEQSDECCRRDDGGLRSNRSLRLEALERANALLRKAVAEVTLDTLILKQAASG